MAELKAENFGEKNKLYSNTNNIKKLKLLQKAYYNSCASIFSPHALSQTRECVHMCFLVHTCTNLSIYLSICLSVCHMNFVNYVSIYPQSSCFIRTLQRFGH